MPTSTMLPRPEPGASDIAPDVGPADTKATVVLAVTDATPLALSLIPFALAIGSTSAGVGLDLTTTIGAAIVVLAGASQLAATELLGSDAGLGLILATVALLNARFLLYGGGMNRWLADQSRPVRLGLAALLVDQNYVAADRRFDAITDGRQRVAYLLASTMTLLACYLPAQVIGHVVGAQVPAALGLHLAAPLAFAGMLAMAIRSRPAAATAVTAGVLLMAGSAVVGGAALPLAVVAALAVGVRLTPRPGRTAEPSLPDDPSNPEE